MTLERIVELRALAASATRGLPWRAVVRRDENGSFAWLKARGRDLIGYSGEFVNPADAKLCAAARTALPEALDAIEAMRTDLKRACLEVCSGSCFFDSLPCKWTDDTAGKGDAHA